MSVKICVTRRNGIERVTWETLIVSVFILKKYTSPIRSVAQALYVWYWQHGFLHFVGSLEYFR